MFYFKILYLHFGDILIAVVENDVTYLKCIYFGLKGSIFV